ncbi:glycosyltransferase [Paraflavitalea pollutisoli]|uniref:glycosyltransferase n=1 Tax=Paraflavitalea pollutisoli TaxID=3034143 RepID=UPI0023EAD590|nr:glycosyltransferase [Paraflavitalea sp. H1-2-19X]
MIKAGVTVLICTYNGADRLRVTLQHLAAQVLPDFLSCEVILVDNASTDHSAAFAQRVWSTFNSGLTFKVFDEPRPGLTHARERGFREAAYEYIILCDDDNWLSEHYVRHAYSIMEANPRIGILGGLGVFAFESTPPSWFGAFNLYAGGAQAAQSGAVADHLVYGAGAVLRRSAYEKLLNHGFEPLLTDRLGYQLSSGGDHELCYALALAGYQVWYDDRLLFHHFITSGRLTQTYCQTYIKESSRCFAVLEPYKILLKTGNNSLTSFRMELLKSFGYHVRKLTALMVSPPGKTYATDRGITLQLDRMLLRLRLASYREFKLMEQHYRRAVAFRQRFLSPSSTKSD